MKRTKIICTMGPNTVDPEVTRSLMENGMDVARFNFSHGTHEEKKVQLDQIRKLREELNIPVATMLDTKGPEIRTGRLEGGQKVTLADGQDFTLTSREVTGNSTLVGVTYKELPEDLKPGDKVLIDDGLIELSVKEIKGPDILCTVVNGGELGEQKGINVPNVKTGLPALTDKDREDILFGIEEGFDFIAASFIRDAAGVREIRAILDEAGSPIKIISKIENAEGIDNLDEIIRESDGIMIARGDMGVEIPPERVPHIQKTIIKKCNMVCKPVITATQMLDSMIRNPRPTRAEVADVANAVYDGTDVVMLSGETANGKYPLEALKMMVNICEQTEANLDYTSYRGRLLSGEILHSITNAVCYSSVSTAYDLNARAIVAPSISGFTTRMLSKWRPVNEIIGLSPKDSSVRQMQLLWGVRPLKSSQAASTDELILDSLTLLAKNRLIKNGDVIIVTAGVINPTDNTPATDTNIMRVIEIKKPVGEGASEDPGR